MEVGVSAKRRLGGARHVQGARVVALARGAWPWPCAVHDVGATHRRKWRGGGPTAYTVHRGDAEASVRRRNTQTTRGTRCRHARPARERGDVG
jgi:hypothetical protein